MQLLSFSSPTHFILGLFVTIRMEVHAVAWIWNVSQRPHVKSLGLSVKLWEGDGDPESQGSVRDF